MVKDNIHVDDVLYIISGTKARQDEDFHDVIAKYVKLYWKNCKTEAEYIALRLFEEGKILQPRLINEDSLSTSGPNIDYKNQRWLSTMDTKEAIDGSSITTELKF